MTWTAPATQVTGTLITAATWNAQITENMKMLQVPNSTVDYKASTSATTTSASFVDLDTTNLSWTVTTSGGNMLLLFTFVPALGSATFGEWDFSIDGTSATGSIGYYSQGASDITLVSYVTGLAAAAHVVRIQCRRTAGVSTIGIAASPLKQLFVGIGT